MLLCEAVEESPKFIGFNQKILYASLSRKSLGCLLQRDACQLGIVLFEGIVHVRCVGGGILHHGIIILKHELHRLS